MNVQVRHRHDIFQHNNANFHVLESTLIAGDNKNNDTNQDGRVDEGQGISDGHNDTALDDCGGNEPVMSHDVAMKDYNSTLKRQSARSAQSKLRNIRSSVQEHGEAKATDITTVMLQLPDFAAMQVRGPLQCIHASRPQCIWTT